MNISDETLFSYLIYCFSLFGNMLFGFLVIRWNTPSRVWYITSRCLAYIRWNTFLVFNILLLAFWNMLFGFLDIRRNTPSCVWCITSPYLDIRWNTPSRVSHITSLCSEIRWNTCVYSWVLCIVFVSLSKGNGRSNFETLSSRLSKYKDSIPLADRNRNNLLALRNLMSHCKFF